ncbi:MAG: hypothetical protein QOJ22_640 [Thermoleophilaceae bacterium]|nr:hypothetical protein [Thermoleophilaceae bacterium]
MSDEKLRLGGMALRNGLLVHGPTHWAAAVRTRDGEVKVASGRKPTLGGALDGVPGLRGVARLGEAFAVIPLVKRALPEARLPMQDARTLAAMAGAAVAGRALRRTGSRTLMRETGVALLSLVPAVMALRQGDLASYHGVEHKAIAAYEQDGETADADKEHDRCGSNLVAPMLAATAAGSVAVRRAGLSGPAAEGAVALGSIAVAVEVFGWSERHAETALARALRRPGYEIQRLVGTREPSEEQIEVGQAALAEILRREGV